MNEPLLDIQLSDGVRLLVDRLPAAIAPGLRQKASREAVAALLRYALGPDASLSHREDGAPFLPSFADVHITLSHSRNYAAVALGPMPLGIDVEEPREQLRRVAPRVLDAEELARCGQLNDLLRAWTIKEALYKLHPSGAACDFRTNMRIDPPTVTGIPARIIKEIDLHSPAAHLTLLADE